MTSVGVQSSSVQDLSEDMACQTNRAAAPAKVRVLHLHSGNMYGGVETLLVVLAKLRHLCPGMEPCFGLCFEGRLSRELEACGAEVHLLGGVRMSRPWTVWRARGRLADLLDRERFDAVICHQHWPLVVFGRTARAAGQKVVLWAHNYHGGRGWLERRAERVSPDLAISDSASVAGTMSNIYPGVPGCVLYYPLALVDAPEAPQWRLGVRSEQGIADGTVVIIQVSRFEPWKGHLLHLRSLARLSSQNWICWIVGGPQNPLSQRHYEAVRQTAVDLGISDRVRFLGERSDVQKLLAAADIFCQPNEGPEPFGIVFVEALWAGRPVVTTAMGGPLEILNESCGLMAEPGNEAQIAQQLDRLIQSSELRARLGEAGPVRARELCDPATQMESLRRLMVGMIEGKVQ